MPDDTIALYDRIAGRFGDVLDACPPDRWASPSPCPGWTARDVAAHVVRNTAGPWPAWTGRRSRRRAPTRT